MLKRVKFDSRGNIKWVVSRLITAKESAISAAENKKRLLINEATEYVNSKQWPGKAAIGRLKGDELAQYHPHVAGLSGYTGIGRCLKCTRY
ncbi:hypothetical protein OIPHN330_35020 [Citrobacter freundii]|nr:hypothetical protein OIPHN330_35020 [Citrobacter freundii]